MTTNQNEIYIKQTYPDAKIEQDGALFFVFTGNGYNKKDLGAGFSKDGAWCSAANKLNSK
jgi:hypothetical protein